MNNSFIDLMTQRRSIYALGKNVPQSKEEITTLIKEAIKQSPTAFNNQTTRAVILFGNSSDKVWDMTIDVLRSIMSDDDAFEQSKARVSSFKNGIGTILYFSDQDAIEESKKQFAPYAQNMHDWSEQGLGGAQFSVWTTLASNNIGANIQHYNPIIDDQVKEAFDIPENWVLRAQMPFGSVENPAGDKDFLDDSTRFKVFED
ncbi:nitroreductase family protein [Holzapfeliella floricola]|uniref:Nitroreductase n=1 Tax=Holzapfeliella floricola DSM 23037 = JCM 16512 TaxID=1423744 RepID=A0A0R2DWS4_9LACO|nr:nitroreductase family protein [Holzapfeliella floricola]KRN04765.1 nitroreductase [Holzapfeliella floricola DSM 23037 = JCM 16512]